MRTERSTTGRHGTRGAGRRRPVRVLAAALAAQACGPLFTALLGTLGALMMRDLRFEEVFLGAAVSTLFGAGAVAATTAGRITDSLGWRWTLRCGAIASAAALAGASAAGGRWTLLAAALVGGAGLALVSTASNAALASEFPARLHGRVFGVKQSAFPLTGLLAGVALPTVATTVGWRAVYVLATVVPLIALVCTPSGRSAGRTVAPRRARARPPRPLVLLAVAGGIGIGVTTALSSFLVVYGIALGLSERLLGTVVASASIVALTARLGVGWAADRASRSGLRAVAAMLSLLAVGAILIRTGIPALFIVGAYIALGPGWGWGGLIRSGVVRLLGVRARASEPVGGDRPSAGSSTGVIESGMNGGSAVGGILFGYAVSALGYPTAWAGLAALAIVASAMALAAASLLRRGAGRPSPDYSSRVGRD